MSNQLVGTPILQAIPHSCATGMAPHGPTKHKPPPSAEPTPPPPAPTAAAAAPTPPAPTAPEGAGGLGGIRSELLDDRYSEVGSGQRVVRQNAKMLKITLGESVLARQGSMVAFQGNIDFDHEGSGGVGKFMKKALTGEGVTPDAVFGNR